MSSGGDAALSLSPTYKAPNQDYSNHSSDKPTVRTLNPKLVRTEIQRLHTLSAVAQQPHNASLKQLEAQHYVDCLFMPATEFCTEAGAEEFGGLSCAYKLLTQPSESAESKLAYQVSTPQLQPASQRDDRRQANVPIPHRPPMAWG